MITSAAIDRLFAAWARRDSPGAVVAVTRHGEEIHSGAYGMANLAHAIPLDRQSVLRIGSQSKQFTVMLALMLEAEGKLSLDDEVQRYAPWLPRYPQSVRLHHLASNRSGLRDFLEVSSWSGLPLAAPSTRQVTRDLLSRHAEVNFPPGTAMLYSNTGFFLLSEILEEVSGRSFNELLAARITGPLGMADTRLLARDSQILPHLVSEHLRDADGAWKTAQWGWPLGGEGGMVSTLTDMLTWQAALTHPQGAMAGMLARMEAPIPYSNGTTGLYSLGLVRNRYRGLLNIGHGGGTAGSRSYSVRFPDQQLGIAILANHGDISPYELALRIVDSALEAELAPGLGDAGPRRLAEAAGLYRHTDGDDIFEIFAVDGMPKLRSGQGTSTIAEIAPGTFAPEAPTLHLTLSQAGDGMLDATFCGTPRRYRRLDPTATGGKDISGTYANAALGLDATIGADDSLLIRSDVGAIRTSLAWIDSDLLAVRPHGTPVGAPRLATLQITQEGLALTSDRTKRLTLRKA